jgi:voltage-gated potassium channel
VSHWRRLTGALIALLVVLIVGTIGYIVLGFGALDAAYQTVTTVSTVGFREVEPLSDAGKAFTIVLIVAGVGTALYTLSALVETLVEGRLMELLGRRRMDKSIAALHDHVIICGWGRVGRAIAQEVAEAGRELVVVELDPNRLPESFHHVVGDATDDEVLRSAGIERAASLVAAVVSDAANSFITLSGRALKPDLFIVGRVRSDDSGDKLLRAGADRVVNPQVIGGARMAAFVLHPHVAAFLDVAMHERNIEFRLEEVAIAPGSPLLGRTLEESRLREHTGALVLALRDPDGSFHTNPPADTPLTAEQVIIAIGTQEQLEALTRFVTKGGS